MITKEFIEQEYVNNKRSIYDIATELGTYANKIKRAVLKYGFALRNKSEAQSIALKSGRHKHPTKGTKHKASTLIKISEGTADAWKNISKEEHERRVKRSIEIWENMSEEDRIALRKASTAAINKTKSDGSKVEKYLLRKIREQKIQVEFHKKGLLDNDKMHLDLFLTELGLAIEVDGPAHFYPIWGRPRLNSAIRSDEAKTGWLLSRNFILIRIKQTTSCISQKYLRDLWEVLFDKIQTIKTNRPRFNNRFIEVTDQRD